MPVNPYSTYCVFVPVSADGQRALANIFEGSGLDLLTAPLDADDLVFSQRVGTDWKNVPDPREELQELRRSLQETAEGDNRGSTS